MEYNHVEEFSLQKPCRSAMQYLPGAIPQTV